MSLEKWCWIYDWTTWRGFFIFLEPISLFDSLIKQLKDGTRSINKRPSISYIPYTSLRSHLGERQSTKWIWIRDTWRMTLDTLSFSWAESWAYLQWVISLHSWSTSLRPSNMSGYHWIGPPNKWKLVWATEDSEGKKEVLYDFLYGVPTCSKGNELSWLV